MKLQKINTKLQVYKNKFYKWVWFFYYDYIRSIYRYSKIYIMYTDIKMFIINAWKYRKELSYICHVDYHDELFILINRFNIEFAKNDWVFDVHGNSKKSKKRNKIRFKTVQKLCKNILDDKYIYRGEQGKKDEIRDYEMLSNYLRKYSGMWWA